MEPVRDGNEWSARIPFPGQLFKTVLLDVHEMDGQLKSGASIPLKDRK